MASLALISLSDCSGSDGSSVLTPPSSLTMKPPFHSAWQNGAYALLDANGRTVIATKYDASTGIAVATSSFSSGSFSIKPPQQPIAIGSQVEVGSGITVYRSAENIYSWTAPNGNNGTVTKRGDQALVSSSFLAKRTGNDAPLAVQIAPSVGRTPENAWACTEAVWAADAAYTALSWAGISAAAQLFADPVTDIAFGLALISYGLALAAQNLACR